ncbi:MAG: cation:proton antiporter [Gammaproteobacteria bacterium]|nr:cation:proton antiporter [Gammaproteobacteria bacterium]
MDGQLSSGHRCLVDSSRDCGAAVSCGGFWSSPGFLVAGVLVGPSGLALIDNVSEIGQLAELGVILLLFVIGSERSTR